MTADIREFFEQYRDAFNRLDGAAVAQLYAEPSGIASDKGYTHWPTREPIQQNMVALCEVYRINGFASAHFEESAFFAQSDMYAVADLFWTIDRINGLAPWTFHTTYNLIRTAQGWKVLLCTAYEEQRLNP